MEFAQRPQHEPRHVGEVVGPGRQPEIVEPGEEDLEGDMLLDPREIGARAPVLAGRERQVAAGVRTVEVEHRGVGEHRRVAVGGGVAQVEDRSFVDGNAAELDILGNHPPQALGRRLEAQ